MEKEFKKQDPKFPTQMMFPELLRVSSLVLPSLLHMYPQAHSTASVLQCDTHKVRKGTRDEMQCRLLLYTVHLGLVRVESASMSIVHCVSHITEKNIYHIFLAGL